MFRRNELSYQGRRDPGGVLVAGVDFGLRRRRVLAGELLALLHQDVLHVLLRDARAALGDVLGRGVAQERPQRADRVDGAVLVEAVVLDRDERGAHHRGDVGERDVATVLVVEGRDHVAVRVQDPAPLALGRRVEGERQAGHPVPGGLGPGGGSADERQGQRGDQQSAEDADEDEQHARTEQGARAAGGAGGAGGGSWLTKSGHDLDTNTALAAPAGTCDTISSRCRDPGSFVRSSIVIECSDTCTV